MKPASCARELYQTIDPDEELEANDERYVDFSPARGDEDLVQVITRRILNSGPSPHRRLITGHRGNGKSTELKRLQAALEKEKFLVAFLDVENSLDLPNLEYLDILTAVAEQLFAAAHKNRIPVDDRLLSDVEKWFSETVITQELWQSAEVSLSTEAGLGGEVPLLARLLAGVTGLMRRGGSTRQEVRQKIENRLDDLLNRLALLTDNITEHSRRLGWKGLVVIVDSLEKMPLKMLNDQGLTNQEMVFVEHAEQLKALPCHLIATVPVSLTSNRNLGIAFTDIDLIPMVKICTMEGDPWKEGRDLLFQAIAKRAEIDQVFELPELVYELIDFSGGVVRDLMRLVLFAADYSSKRDQIDRRAVEKAKSKLTREYDRLIHADDLEVLRQVAANPHLANTSTLARLMFNRLVLAYMNGDDWKSLHPAVRQAPTYRTGLPLEKGEG